MRFLAMLGVWRFFLLMGFVGLMVFASAEPVWDPVAYNSVYHFSEDTISYHNFTANLSDVSDLDHFLILDVSWVNGLVGSDHSNYYWLPWNDSAFSNSSSGVLDVNAGLDNETGNFTLNVYAQGAQTGTAVKFNFIINATNDAPNFTDLNLTYDFPQDELGYYSVNAVDEEEHYPLNFNLTFINNCSHAAWSGRVDGENCSIFNLSGITDTSVDFDFNPTLNDVGTYWANFSVKDFNGTCPHQYCDAATYELNQSSGVYLLTFNVYSTLSIDVSNCSGASITEGDTFNCTINITTREETDELNFSSYAFFSSNPAMTYDENNRDWFYADSNDNASNFFYSLPVSVTPSKKEVGNWTINFSVEAVNNYDIEIGQIEIFVDYNESLVSLDAISNLTLYANGSFDVSAYDDDLLIYDTSVKNEVLTFFSNTSWVSPGFGAESSGNNYSISTVDIDYDYALNDPSWGEGNYSINISVSDLVGNLDWKVFVVEILNETAPVWNSSLSNPVVLNLTEDQAFVYNVSVNVSDPGETVSFYYQNVSEEFCSLTPGNFNSNGLISFTPEDCDVGFHNVSIISGNGKLNSSWNFIFNVSNVLDVPIISQLAGENGTSNVIVEGSNFIVPEGLVINFSLDIEDYDFLIPSGQESYYNESLVVNVTFMNSTGSYFDLFNFSFLEFAGVSGEIASYIATFVPGVAEVGDYTVFVNITDVAGDSTNRTWFLNVTESLDAPVLEEVSNISLTINDYINFSVNGTDEEDDYAGLNLTYSVVALTSGAPNLTVVDQGVEFNLSSNNSYSGEWEYNVSVTDSDGMVDWQVFYLFAYGFASLFYPAENFSFNLTENSSSYLNFTINHSVGDNLTYEFWIDNVSCGFQNNSNCSYGNFSLRNLTSSFGNGSFFNWSFIPNFRDESYGLYKNLTVRVYPNTTDLNFSQRELLAVNFSFKLNISHANAPVVFYSVLGMESTSTTNVQDVSYDLSEFFSDADIDDSYYSQNLTLVIRSDSASNIDANGQRLLANFSQSGWNLVFSTGYTAADFSEVVNVTVYDLDPNNNNITLTSAVSNNFELTFTIPETTTTPSGGGGGGSTKIKFYSLRIIVPDDVIISDEDYIDVPFGLENSGTIDLNGIDLSSQVLYNNEFANDVSVDLGVGHLDSLKSGERKNYTMRILADTDRSGKYKATIFANITSPKFQDWGDFFIDLRRTNESEAEKLLVFTSKMITDNPECLELTEVFRRAQEAFDAGNKEEAMRLSEEVSSACEDAISANEQVRYRIEGFVERNFYYISFATLMIFFVGFIFYVYKRVRFNKSVEDIYVR